ncbi:ABC transporter permease [Neobacillus sp. YIM B06451]|uniref:ABC transporter permease n=1 Tax=Neobacillus sp. YIM B06451 TaxID=3070994 RepID=UPI0029311715|nr:ABC transporter permease [Neobacillus sp. YIM B06451]
MSSILHPLWQTANLQMRLSIARPMFQFIIWISPLFYATLSYFIYGKVPNETLVQYVLLGSGFMALWSSIVYSSASDINRERFYGTLENIFVAPTPFSIILLGKIVGNTIWGIIAMGFSVLYLVVFFRVQVVIAHPLLFFLALLLVIFALIIFSFFLALFFTLSRQAEALMNFLEYPIYFICGFLFPISILPDWIQPLSYILPPTWAIVLLRETLAATNTDAILKTMGILLVLSLVYGLIAWCCYKAVERKARVDGKLGVY